MRKKELIEKTEELDNRIDQLIDRIGVLEWGSRIYISGKPATFPFIAPNEAIREIMDYLGIVFEQIKQSQKSIQIRKVEK